MKRVIELQPASVFVCEECGRDSFVRLRRIEPEAWNDEMRAVAAEAMEDTEAPEGWEEGVECLAAPREVACQHCGTEYRAEHL